MDSPPDNVAATLQQILQMQQTFQQNQQTFQQNQQHIQQNLTALTTEVTQLRHRFGPPGFGPYGHEPPAPPAFAPTSIKLDIPRFDGKDPLSWIFKINQFFEFHRTPEDQRLRLASFYMEGEALTWFQWMHANRQLLTWPMFLHALELRFAPSQYEDPKGSLFKLCQTTSVKEYQAEFEALANRIVGLPHQFYLSCFISGLKPEIRREVQAFQPISLSNAISLAKLQEEKHSDRSTTLYPHRPSGSSSYTTTTQNTSLNTTNHSQTRPPNTPNLTLTSNTTAPKPPKTPPPVKLLSPAELQARREKGLCYNCDERWTAGHRCKRQFHLLVAIPETPELSDDVLTEMLLTPQPNPNPNTLPDPDTQLDTQQAQISLHALLGHTIPQTL